MSLMLEGDRAGAYKTEIKTKINVAMIHLIVYTTLNIIMLYILQNYSIKFKKEYYKDS